MARAKTQPASDPSPPTTTTTTAYYGHIALSVNGALSYTLSDPVLGSVGASINLNGAVTATQLYSPYGTVRFQSGMLPTDYGFTHQRSDASTSGLDDYGARYYDPVVGQFTSADTTLAGGLNRYAYVGGNPETRTDPSGHRYANPRDWQNWKYRDQMNAKPVQAYVNQWAAPGSVGDFVQFVGQAVFATDTLKQTLHTMFDPHASLGDKAKATGVFGFTAVTDAVTIVSMFVGEPEIGEGVRSADLALATAADLDHVAIASDASLAASDAGVGGDLTGVPGCGESFTPETQVATPTGERPIAALKVGDHVTAYDPATGKRTTQTIERVFINHDTDRLDVTLAYHTASHAAGQTASPTSATGHGRQAPATARDAAATEASAAQAEVIHTTASHPWLTTDRGWLRAGQLRVGEPVRLLDGATATVVALHTLPGVGPMWDLSLDATHTFAVGDVQAVVHNDSCTTTSISRFGRSPDLLPRF